MTPRRLGIMPRAQVVLPLQLTNLSTPGEHIHSRSLQQRDKCTGQNRDGWRSLLSKSLMEDAEKDPEDYKLDIQTSYSTTIKEFRIGLLQWLEKEPEPGEIVYFQDPYL